MFVPFHSDIQPDQPEMLTDGSWGSLTPSEALPRTLNIHHLFRLPLTDTCSTCSLAGSSLFTYTKFRRKNWRQMILCHFRSMWCLYPQRSPLLGSFLHEVIRFRCLHWGSSHTFKFSPFPESSGTDPTVPCLDGTSASWVQAVPLLPRHQVGAQGWSQPRLHQLGLGQDLSEFTVNRSGLSQTP